MSLDIYSFFDYPDLEFVNEEITEKVIHFTAKPKHPNKICCPNCGSTEKNSNGNYIRTYQDLPMLGKHVMIHVETKEYLCRNRDCETVSYVPEFSCGKKKDTLTYRLKEEISKQAFKKISFNAVAEQYGVDEKVVRELFDKRSTAIKESATYAPVKHLGIDEAHLAKKARLVLINTGVTPSKIIDIGPIGARKAPLVDALYRFEDYESIETVTIDMNPAYLSALDEVYPFRKTPTAEGEIIGPRVIIDRFHVMSYVIDATESARKILYQRIKDSIADITVKAEREIAQKKLAAYRMTPYWFKKNFEDLSDSSKRYLFDFISAYPEFGTLLRTKESFRNIYENSVDVEDAEKRYFDWLRSIPGDSAYDEFRSQVIPMIDKHHVEIFNYFVDPPDARYSNGPVESRNCQIKDIMRIAKGASFDTIRAKVLYGEGRVATCTSIAAHRKPPKGPRFEDIMSYMDGIRTDKIISSVRSCIEAFLVEDLKRYSEEYNYEGALKYVRESGRVDELLHSVRQNNNIQGRLFEIAERLDTEEHPEHPMLLGVTEDEFMIEAMFYLLNGENMSVPLSDCTEGDSDGFHIRLM